MKRIVVTPAGRKRYLEILYLHLLDKKNEFDEWHLWVNTNKEEDVAYIYSLEKENSWIKTVSSKIKIVPRDPVATINQFYEYCTEEDSMYLKLDDDICFIEKESIDKIFKERENNKKNLLVIGNTINNPMISYYYQRYNIIPKYPACSGKPKDPVGWGSIDFAKTLHNLFLKKHKENNLDHFYLNNIDLVDFPLISINAICWSGSMFNRLGGSINQKDHDEEWFTRIITKKENITNLVLGNTLFCHFSFNNQVKDLEQTSLLSRYRSLI
jgi:hypothetical protein